MELKKNFTEIAKKAKTYNDLKEYLEDVVSFERCDESEKVILCEELVNKINEHDFKNKRVWAMFGSNDNNDFDCLQVGQEKDIAFEIVEDVQFMFKNEYDDLIKCDEKNLIELNTYFYEKAYKRVKSSADKREFMCSKMLRDYKYFKICILDVDEYLSLEDFEAENENINNIIKIAKYKYSVGKLAYETLVKYWNVDSSIVDAQTVVFFMERDNLIKKSKVVKK